MNDALNRDIVSYLECSDDSDKLILIVVTSTFMY